MRRDGGWQPAESDASGSRPRTRWIRPGYALICCAFLCAALAGGARPHSTSLQQIQGMLSNASLPSSLPSVGAGTITCPSSTSSATQDFLACGYAGPDGTRMTFYLYPPQGYNPQRRYPLVLILHGGGERAQTTRTDAQNRAALLNQQYVDIWGPGWPKDGPSVQANWPCFVVVPQVTGSNRWVDVPASRVTYPLAQQPSPSLEMAMAIVLLLHQRYTSVDMDRLYVTGLSMGGFGVWDAIERWPSLFAAAVPLAGAGDPALATRIAQEPVWAFHGTTDQTVPVQGSRLMIAAMRAAGGHPCYTEYSGDGHGIWGQVYTLGQNGDTALFDWLFSQRKGQSPTASASCG